jgi:hypothetical protein
LTDHELAHHNGDRQPEGGSMQLRAGRTDLLAPDHGEQT